VDEFFMNVPVANLHVLHNTEAENARGCRTMLETLEASHRKFQKRVHCHDPGSLGRDGYVVLQACK
jgi:hypothetical protein